MLSKALITVCVLFYAVGSPIVEVNSSHVFNPDWTPHVRIHEVWQLITNSSIGFIVLWLIWIEKRVVLGAAISLAVMGSFIVAYALQDLYGGSMKFLNGSENLVFGINFGLLVSSSIVITLLLAIYIETKTHIKPSA